MCIIRNNSKDNKEMYVFRTRNRPHNNMHKQQGSAVGLPTAVADLIHAEETNLTGYKSKIALLQQEIIKLQQEISLLKNKDDEDSIEQLQEKKEDRRNFQQSLDVYQRMVTKSEQFIQNTLAEHQQFVDEVAVVVASQFADFSQ